MVFSQLYPPDTEDVSELRRWCVSLIDQLRIMFGNLDEENVKKAGSVDADAVNQGTLNNVAITTPNFRVDEEGNMHIENPNIVGLKVWAPDDKSYMEFSDQCDGINSNNITGCIRICDGSGAEVFAIAYMEVGGDIFVRFVCGGHSANLSTIIHNNQG